MGSRPFYVTIATIVVVFLTSSTSASPSSSKDENLGNLKAPDAGNWTVGECILAQFAMELAVHYNKDNINDTMVVDVSPKAVVDAAASQCGQSKQTLTLVWSDPAVNDTSVQLNRSLTVEFAVMPNDTFYGVLRLSATFDVATWTEEIDNVTIAKKSVVKVDTKEDPKLMFHTPLERSYLCANIGDMEIETSLFYDETEIKLANSTLTAKKVQLDAFRTKDRAPPGFRTPLDCDYRPNDIVPIAVGVALALLVVTVLISYLVGRRRYQRGYQSV